MIDVETPFAALCVGSLLIGMPWLTHAETTPAPAPATAVEPAAVLDAVLVTGERPGPGMWRVSKDGHELWILGTLAPLPKKMTWRSTAAEMRIAASQAVLAPPNISTDVGFFRGLTLVPALLRARQSPDGETLEQVLPHDLYIRWLALSVKFLGRWNNDEHRRPLLAALDLYMHAIDASGLTADDGVWDVIDKTARKHHVPVLPVTIKLPIEDPKGSIRQLDQIPRAAEIACLATTIGQLETDLQTMRERANLWSLGDVDGLRRLSYPDEGITCLNAVFSVPTLRAQFDQARGQVVAAWLAAADGAIARNESSFAVLSITEMLKPDGWLARLRAQGYVIQEP